MHLDTFLLSISLLKPYNDLHFILNINLEYPLLSSHARIPIFLFLSIYHSISPSVSLSLSPLYLYCHPCHHGIHTFNHATGPNCNLPSTWEIILMFGMPHRNMPRMHRGTRRVFKWLRHVCHFVSQPPLPLYFFHSRKSCWEIQSY